MLRAFPMSLTGAASRWLRNKPFGSITTWEDLKTKFLSKYCPPAQTVMKMEEINNFQQEPDANLYQAWERFKLDEVSSTLFNGDVGAIQEMAEYSQKWHNGTSRTRSTETSDGLAAIQAQLNNLGREIKKVNEKVYAAQVGWGYRATAPGFYQRNNANPSYQERRQSMEETLSKFMGESAKRHEENSNLIKEIRASTNAAIRNQGASIKTLEIQIGDHVKSISTTVEADASSIRHIGSSQYAVSTGQNTYGALHINKSIPRKEKDPGSFTLPCYINNVCFDNALADIGASVSVMPLSTYLNLRLGELTHTKLTVELADRTVKYPKGIAENVLVRIGKFVFPVDFIILDMPEDIKVPLILRRPFLSTVHAKIDVFKRKITLRVGEEKIIFKRVKPASSLIKRVYMLSLRERMELDLEARIMGETLVVNRSLDPLFGDYIELNDLNVPIELKRDQVDDLMATIEEGEVVEEFRARNDARLKIWMLIVDEGMGDVIFGKPFLREVGINAKRFEGMINGNNESSNNGWRRWEGYEIADHDHEEREHENEHEYEERCELFDNHELSVCTVRRFEMIKYSFGQDEEYVAVK
ncbi:mitochondrial proton/calcium exchanger protein-like protein isoform X1 [Tanacetum coccineum]